MRILCLIDSLGSGGAQRQMVSLLKMLKTRGYNVELLCYHKEEFFADELMECEIPMFWKTGNNGLKRMILIRKFIRNRKYDVVISYLTVPNFLNCFAALGGKNWRVITGERSSEIEVFSTIQGKIFAWFQRYADVIVCNSYNAQNMWATYYPKYKNKLTTIYNKINLSHINTEYIPKKNNKLHVVIAASYDNNRKNPFGLIEALKLLTIQDKDRIVVYWYGEKNVTNGGTKTFDDSLILIKDYGLENIIHLKGPTKDIMNKMNQADMVALVSSVEGLPNTICEGMMLSKPVLMTRVSDYKVLVDESNGFLCDWDNPESIKDALVSAMNKNEEQLIEMGRNSKSKAISLFSEEKIIREWIATIEQNVICE